MSNQMGVHTQQPASSVTVGGAVALLPPFETQSYQYFLRQATALGPQFIQELNAARLEFRTVGLLQTRGCISGSLIFAVIGGEAVHLTQGQGGKYILYRIYPNPLVMAKPVP